MKTTKFHKGHRWENDEIRALMKLWGEGKTVDEIAIIIGSSRPAISKMIVRLRKYGIPLARRTKGNITGRSFQPWTQGEIEYLTRRRYEKSTSEEIAIELGRTWHAIDAMIQKLRKEGVAIPMRGQGVRRRWDPTLLKASICDEKKEEIKEVETA